jgi:bifunctional non-homologous end joining protein LigD
MLRTPPAGFITPCLPTKTDMLPSGDRWLHEIKHDGFRVIARKDGDRVRLYSRPGNDMTRRFPLIAEAMTGLRSRSCIIDGEAVACDDNGLASPYVVEFRTAEGESLAISIRRTETAVIRHFQERMPYGLFVPDVNAI